MAEKKSLVEEALIQMKNLENVVSENAKGILASTMKEEISELVKESLKEAKEEESEQEEVDMEMDTDIEDDNMSMDDDSLDMDSDEETVDLTQFDDEDIMKIIASMDDDDKIIVTKDSDDSVDVEKLSSDSHSSISLGDMDMSDEDMEMSDEDEEEEEEEMEESWENDESKLEESDEDETMEMDESDEEETMEMDESDEEETMEMDESDEEETMEMDESDEEETMEMDEYDEDETDEEVVYEISFDDETEFGDEESSDWEEIDLDNDEDSMVFESKKKKETKEGSMTVKPKGVGMGKPGKVYPKSLKHGVTEKKATEKVEAKEGKMTVKPKGVGMGKPKFEYKEGKKMVMKPVKKGGETSEASRTLGAGRKFGRKGLPKPKAAPRHLNVENVENELNVLRERNEEYRKALNIFRTKLNEVAVFNSNLAYATRLFTEHSTTKQEKINILRRFDSVESLKESKALYKSIKDELSSHGESKVVKESIEKIEKTPSSGSATNLIESKTYENPQFLRMKDLMSKMNIIK